MSRKYTKIDQYKNQILSMKKEGKTQREIAERLGVEKEQIKEWAVKNRSRSQDSPTRQTAQRFRTERYCSRAGLRDSAVEDGE